MPICPVCGKPGILPIVVPHPILSLTLRAVLTTDAADIAHHGNDERVTRYLPAHFPRPYTVEAANAWIATTHTRLASELSTPPHDELVAMSPAQQAHALHHVSLPALAIALDDRFIGSIGCFPHSGTQPVVLGYWLSAEWHRRGIMSALLRTLMRWKESDWEEGEALGSPTRPCGFQVTVHEDNAANLAVVAQLGFTVSKAELESRRERILTLDRPRGWQPA